MRRFEFCWPGVEKLAWIVVYPKQYFENMAHFGTICAEQCVTVRIQLRLGNRRNRHNPAGK